MAASARLEQPVSPQDDPVVVNWCFFNPPNQPHAVHFLKIPRQLFNGPSEDCWALFEAALAHTYTFAAQRWTLLVWVPKAPISRVGFIGGVNWPASVDGLQGGFDFVHADEALVERVAAPQDRTFLHIVVTALGAFKPRKTLDRLEAEVRRERVTGLPENLRFLAALGGKGPTSPAGSNPRDYTETQGTPGQVIYDGRWAKSTVPALGPPIQLFSPVFEQFVLSIEQDVSLQPSIGDLVNTQELMHAVSRLAPGPARAPELRTILSKILSREFRREPGVDAGSAGGAVSFAFEGVYYPFCILETQRGGEADPSIQASLSMRRIWTQDNRAGFAKKFCCPTLILSCDGPWLAVHGGVFTDKFIVQRLTDLLWIGRSSTHEEPRVRRLARVLVALRNALSQLHQYYEKTSTSSIPAFKPSQPHPRTYPYPTSFIDSTTHKTLHFQYTGTTADSPACTAYKARIHGPGPGPAASHDVVVKFVPAYGTAAHKLLWKHGHAPALRYCGPPLDGDVRALLGAARKPLAPDYWPEDHELPGGLPPCPVMMVIVDHVAPGAGPWPVDAFAQIEGVLRGLHGQGYVHGGLRPPHVLFDANDRVQFVGFDWAGPYDPAVWEADAAPPVGEVVSPACAAHARYSLGLSEKIEWAQGAGALLPIRPAHDLEMLEKLRASVALRRV